jgi:hypothetical protein
MKNNLNIPSPFKKQTLIINIVINIIKKIKLILDKLIGKVLILLINQKLTGRLKTE